ncbi:MAG: hypothetical protein M1819_004259 [Sarea resinae]|nr:MAG: hypothetical protein M1819_004259 [Sarea resinae]
MAEDGSVDYTLNNPDTLTKYKTAAQISQKVLEAVTGWCVEGETILKLCERGDKLLEEEIAKVYKGKKISKGISHPTTVSPSSFVTPYTPLSSDAEEATVTLKASEVVKIQLGAQIDGFGTIVCDTIIVPSSENKNDELPGREADLLLATHYANELLLRLMVPRGLLASGTEEEKKKAAAEKHITQSRMNSLLQKVVESYGCSLVESTTCWLFERNEIEGKKKIVLAPGEGVKGEGIPELGEVWGVEVGVSLGTGKVKNLANRTTLHRRTTTTYGLKRPSSRATLSEIVKKFGTFPFSLRQLDDERAAKVGVVECVRSNVLRQYEVVGDKDGEPVARLFSTVAITKNGITRLSAPASPDLEKFKTDKKITDEEVLKILEQPIAKNTGTKSKNKKKKKKTAKKVSEEEEGESSDEDVFIRFVDLARRRAVMTSMRPTRKSSRVSSPSNLNGRISLSMPSTDQAKGEKKKTFMDNWVEPPLRPAAPSFEDYKGLERHGVLEHMAPLGNLPSAKVKARVKADQPHRRVIHTKQPQVKVAKEAKESKERVVTPERTSIPAMGRRSESRRSELRAPKTPISYKEEADDDYIPHVSTRHSAKGASAQASPQTTSTFWTPTGRAQLEEVVNVSVQKATSVGNPVLGLCIKKIFADGHQNRKLAEILEAVLLQRATPQQLAAFQACIKEARKEIKGKGSSSKSSRKSSIAGVVARSTTSASKSPSKSGRSAVTGALRNNVAKEGAEPTTPQTTQTHQKETSAEQKQAQANGMSLRHGRKTRSKSASSSSSLSSLSSLDQNFAPSMEVDHANSAETHAQLQPMNTSQKQPSLGPKLHTFSTSNPCTNNPHKRSSIAAGLEHDDVEVAAAAKRQKLAKAKSFDDYKVTYSSIRPGASRKESDWPGSVAAKPLPSTAGPVHQLRLRNGIPGRIARDEHEELRSPSISLPREFLSPGPSATGKPSRASTPNQLGRPPKKAKKGARIKMSPTKKKTGVIAGIARGGNAGSSSLGYDENEESDNDDLCSACGGSGYLLCCDGCDRSFHLTCLDPPLDPKALPESWFCYICEAKKSPPPKRPRGLFAALDANLEKKNPVAFHLPREIREYFEGVKTGEEGEYEEAVTQKSSRTRPGYDETPDLLKLKDSKGKSILCFRCGKSALSHQEIIPCDFCSLQWHLDCLDPPMANPPPRAPNGKNRHRWMCPNHIDHELLTLDLSVRESIQNGTASGIGRTHKVRRPKNARIVDTALRRGFVNNGLIEIENDESSEAEEFHDQEEFGVVYRLPELGVKLDFIDKIKRTRPREKHPSNVYPATARLAERKLRADAAAEMRLRSDLNKRSFIDRKAALNLAQIASAQDDLNLGANEVENLINTLIAESPEDVVAMMDVDEPNVSTPATTTHPADPPSPPTSEERSALFDVHGKTKEQTKVQDKEKEKRTLLLLQELIRRRLEGAGDADADAGAGATAGAQDQSQDV